MLTELIKILSILSLGHWVIIILTNIVLIAGVTLGFMHWFWRKQWRFHKNLRRPIMMITPTGPKGEKIPATEMELERKMLRDNGFLNIDDQVTDYRSFSPTSNHCLVVLGYHKDMQGLDDVLTKVKNLDVPIIIYTYGENSDAIAENHKDLLKIQGQIQSQTGEFTSMDDVIANMVKAYRKKHR